MLFYLFFVECYLPRQVQIKMVSFEVTKWRDIIIEDTKSKCFFNQWEKTENKITNTFYFNVFRVQHTFGKPLDIFTWLSLHFFLLCMYSNTIIEKKKKATHRKLKIFWDFIFFIFYFSHHQLPLCSLYLFSSGLK